MGLEITVAAIGSRAGGGPFAAGAALYAGRMEGYAGVRLAMHDSEAALLASVERLRGRTAPLLVLLDSRGRTYSSDEFAAWLGRERDGGRQAIVFAIGPASGWSAEARGRADLLLSLGPMTLPHELARVVLIEQVYRAFTILAGHPYHLGH